MVQSAPVSQPDESARGAASILVIDPNEDHQALSVAALGRRGFAVEVAGSVPEALSAARARAFDVVVLAPKGPGASGLDALAALLRGLPGLPVVFVVPPGSEELALKAVRAGASGFLVRTARYQDVLPAEVEEQLSRRSARPERIIRERAKQQAAVARFGLSALAGTDLPGLLIEAVTLIATTLDADHSAILESQGPSESFVYRCGVGWTDSVPGEKVPSSPAVSMAGFAMAAAGPVIVTDIAAETRFRMPAAYERHGIRSGVDVIIPGKERPFGVLGAHCVLPRDFTEDDVHFLQSIANAIATAIERKRVEEDRHRAAETLRAVIASSSAAVIAVDREGNLTLWNPAAVTMFGWGSDEVLGRPLPTVPPDRAAEHRDLLGRALQGEPIVDFETRRVRKDGVLLEVRLSVSPVHDAQGRVTGTMASLTDITERKRAGKVQDAIYRISEAAASAAKLEDLFRAIHAIVGELMYARNFYIALHDPGTDTLSFAYFVDAHEDPPPPQKLHRGLTEYVLRTGRPLLASPEVFADLLHRGEVVLVGHDSIDWLGVPLVAGDRPIGVLVVQSYTEGTRYSEADKDILVYVSTQVANAIERKRAEEQTVRSERRFRTLFEAAADGIVVLDRTGQILDLNPAAATILGQGRDALVGRNLGEIIPAGDLERARDYMRQVLRDRPRAEPFSMVLTALDGRRRFLEVHSKAAREEGREPYVEMVLRDVTEAREMQRRLTESERLASIGSMAGYVAHEINNPLANISLLVASAERKTRDAELLDKLAKISAQRRQAAVIITDLLSFSKQRAIQAVDADLRGILEAAVDQVAPYRKESVELRMNLGTRPIPAEVDPVQMQEVFTNLLKNGLEATSSGSVTVDVEEQGDMLAVRVADTGSGIAPEVMDRLFEPFFTTKGTMGGTGLGLSLCKSVVTAHGGRIQVASEPHRGSTFTVLVPRRQPAREAGA